MFRKSSYPDLTASSPKLAYDCLSAAFALKLINNRTMGRRAYPYCQLVAGNQLPNSFSRGARILRRNEDAVSTVSYQLRTPQIT